MVYSTTSELAEYLEIEESALPSDASRLLKRASELIDYVTARNIDTSDTAHLEACRNAVNAQVEHWIANGENADTQGNIKSFTAGKLSITYGDNGSPVLAPRAYRFLLYAGLLYRGGALC